MPRFRLTELLYDPVNGSFFYLDGSPHGKPVRVTVFDGVGAGSSGVADGTYGDVTVAGSTWTLEPGGTLAGYVTSTSLTTTLTSYATTASLASYVTSASLTTTLGGYVPSTRTISTTAPLTGGGSLAAGLTLAISDFTATTRGAVPSPGGATGKFLRDDATWATPIAGAGGTGTATIDFGTGVGADEATVTITGQTGITTSSLIQLWLGPVATADHSLDEHALMAPFVSLGVSTIVAGTGFTIVARPTGIAPRRNQAGNSDRWLIVDQAAKLQGRYTVQWRWS